MRMFFAIALGCFAAGALSGAADGLVSGRDRVVATREITAQGFTIVALDRKPIRSCPFPTVSYHFTAVRDRHLVVGGACIPSIVGGRAIVVALPPLR